LKTYRVIPAPNPAQRPNKSAIVDKGIILNTTAIRPINGIVKKKKRRYPARLSKLRPNLCEIDAGVKNLFILIS
jgi:hypothetical protein